jgi:hypothetical protein
MPAEIVRCEALDWQGVFKAFGDLLDSEPDVTPWQTEGGITALLVTAAWRSGGTASAAYPTMRRWPGDRADTSSRGDAWIRPVHARYSVEAKLSPFVDEIAACFEQAVTDLISLRPQDRGDGGGLALVYYVPRNPGDPLAVRAVAADLAPTIPLVVSYTAARDQPGLVLAGKFLHWSDLGPDDPWR